jgi:hypothetical protein
MGQLKHRYWTCDARANLATKFKFESDLRKKSFFFSVEDDHKLLQRFFKIK